MPQVDAVSPVQPRIPLSEPEIRGNAWTYVRECLDTGWVSSAGPFVDRFEQDVAKYVGVKYAVATVNGTAALHLALLLAGVDRDDEVLVSALTFIAPANAVRYTGAWPVLVDAEADHWQMDVARVARFLEHDCRETGGVLRNSTTGRRVSAIVAVHVLGHPVDMDPLLDLATRFGLPLIEDATESLGARYKGRMVGALGRMSCLSFNGNKTFTTGGGGMLLTNDSELAARARYLTTQAKDDPIEYVHGAVGYNYRLTNLQAAVGCSQIELAEEFIAAKRAIAARYAADLAAVPGVQMMTEADWASSAFWLSTITVDERPFGMDSRALMRRLAAHGIQTRPLWQPLHRSPALTGSPALGGAVADALHARCLCLPSSVGLSPDAQQRVVEAIASTPRRSS